MTYSNIHYDCPIKIGSYSLEFKFGLERVSHIENKTQILYYLTASIKLKTKF